MNLLSDNLVHVGYTLQLCALLARDILWLRGLLVLAQSVLCYYAVYRGVLPIAGWNAVFVVINTAWVIRILRERAAVRLPDDLVEIHGKYFAALSPGEFLSLWQSGERSRVSDRVLMKEGSLPEALYFLLDGTVTVAHGNNEVTRLQRGDFIGEMSLLTGSPCTADVSARGEVELVRWPALRLQQLRSRNAGLWTRIQSVLGNDLVEKIRRASAPRDPAVAA